MFIYPDVLSHSLRTASASQLERRSLVEGGRLLEHIETSKKLLITSQALGGKTTLAKVLFTEMHRKGELPLLLRGEDVAKLTADNIDTVTADAFRQQYHGDWERFRQLVL